MGVDWRHEGVVRKGCGVLGGCGGDGDGDMRGRGVRVEEKSGVK